MHDYFRGNPDEKQPLRVPARARADPGRVPRPRRPPRQARRARPRSRVAVPDARHALRGAAQARPRAPSRSRSPRSTAGSTRTGASTTRTASSPRPYISLVRPRLGDPRARVGARPRRARDRACARPRRTPADGQTPVSDPAFDPFWARVNEAGITVVVHAGDSGYSSQRLRGRRVRRRVHRRRSLGAVDQSVHHRARRATTSSSRSCSTSCSSASRTCASRRSRTAPSSSATCSRSCARPTARCRATSPRTRSSRSGATSGSTRSGRTTSNEIVELMGADRVIFGSDWPHIEGMPRPLDYATELKSFDDDDEAADPARQRTRAEHAPPRLT